MPLLYSVPASSPKATRSRSARSRASSPPRRLLKTSLCATRCRGQAEDKSGPLLVEGLTTLGLDTSKTIVVPDEKDKIAQVILAAAKVADIIILTGGTGLSPRDVTPEAVQSVCERMVPGIGE